MTLAYFDCFSGISGDMTLGAIVDAGVRSKCCALSWKSWGVPGYEITALKVNAAGLRRPRSTYAWTRRTARPPSCRYPEHHRIIVCFQRA